MDNLNSEILNDGEYGEYTVLGEPLEAVTSQASDTVSADTSFNDEGVSKKKGLKTPVLTFQLIVCLFALTLLFLLKTFLYDVYTQFRELYDIEYNSSVFFSGDFSELDFGGLFTSTDDEKDQ